MSMVTQSTTDITSRKGTNHPQVCDLVDAQVGSKKGKNHRVCKLGLIQNGVGDRGAKLLSTGLKTNSALTEVELDRNSIGDDGAAALADALTERQDFKRLSLGRNQICDDGANSLAQMAIWRTIWFRICDPSCEHLCPKFSWLERK